MTKRSLLFGALALTATLGACDLGYEVCTTHFPSGEVWSVRYYTDGRPDRPWIAWHVNEVPEQRTYYDGGQRTGIWETYAPNGRLLFQREYLADQPHGEWVRYHLNGTKASTATFDAGRAIGTWTWWNDQGDVIAEQRFE